MIDTFKPYPLYSDSGVPWLGKVPKDWEVLRIGNILRERGETNADNHVTEVLSVMRERGVMPYAEKGNVGNKKSDDITRYKIVRPNDIVVNSMNVIIGSVGLSKYTGCLSPVYYVLTRRAEKNDPRYLNAYFQTRPFQQSLVRIGNGILAHRMRIPMELLKCEPFPLPPPEEQVVIVNFLSWTTGRIERAIRAKRRVVELLGEQKQAIIHRVVTHDIDNVALKQSGISWIGDIPKHWQVRRIKQAARILRGRFSYRPRNDPSLYDGQYPFIQTGSVAQAGKFITTYKQTLNERGLAVSKLFPSGTLVMTIAANIGDAAVLTFDACFPDSVVGFIPFKDTDQDYLYLAFRCMKPELLSEAPVNTQGNLNVERIGAMGIPFPPLEEQRRIARWVETETGSFDTAVARLEREIALLREYRTRLVTDVVTGKLDVRGMDVPTEESMESDVLVDTTEVENEDDELVEENGSCQEF